MGIQVLQRTPDFFYEQEQNALNCLAKSSLDMAIKRTLNDFIFFTLNRYIFLVVKGEHSCMNISLFNFDRPDLEPLTSAMKNRL